MSTTYTLAPNTELGAYLQSVDAETATRKLSWLLSPTLAEDTKFFIRQTFQSSAPIENYNPKNILTSRTDGRISADQLSEWLESFMSNGSAHKVAVCDRTAFLALNNADQALIGFRLYGHIDQIAGMQVATMLTPWGRLDLAIRKRDQGGEMIVVDMEAGNLPSAFGYLDKLRVITT